ncbi:unnamed protein product [Musa acuminata subsp. burmannicoides]
MKQQVTNLHFFFHDIAGGDIPTVVHVAAPKNLSSLVKEPSFGTVYAIDDPLTEGPEADSTAVGSAQGFYISSGQDAPMLVFATDFGFAPSACSRRSRAFQLAQGVAKPRTNSINDTSSDAVVEFHYG